MAENVVKIYRGGWGKAAISAGFWLEIDLGRGQFPVCDRWEMSSI
jgi:hypothetical protein